MVQLLVANKLIDAELVHEIHNRGVSYLNLKSHLKGKHCKKVGFV